MQLKFLQINKKPKSFPTIRSLEAWHLKLSSNFVHGIQTVTGQIKNIVIIGAGNLATHLTLALHASGFHIAQIFSQTVASASTLARLIDAPYTTETDAIKNDADIYIFAIKDNALANFLIKTRLKDRFLVHTAGSLPLSIFETYSTKCGVFYPMQTFSKERPVNFSKIPVFIEASDRTSLDTLSLLGKKLGCNVTPLNSEKRKQLHLAAIFAVNFSNHMAALSEQLLLDAGLDFSLMHPLIMEGAKKITQMSPKDAQTGPAVRYDTNIIEEHAALLERHPKMQALYKAISKSIHQLTTQKNGSKEF